MVVSSYRLCIPNDFDKRCLETTTPSAPTKERGHFLYGAATPPSRRRGIRVPQPFSQFGQLCREGGVDAT